MHTLHTGPAGSRPPNSLHKWAGGAGWGRWTRGRTPIEVITDMRAWFTTRVSSEEASCRPNGTTFHSNWPSYHQLAPKARLSKVRTRTHSCQLAMTAVQI